MSDILGKAAGEAREGRLAEAHETLEAVREQLAGLRRANNVVIYSEHVDAYHAEMEHLLRDATRLLQGPKGPLLLMARAGGSSSSRAACGTTRCRSSKRWEQ